MDDNRTIAIVLNGPPRAGKDTAIAILEQVFPDSEVYQFFRPIKELLHKELSLDVPHDHYELLKDTPLPEFGGMTPRQAYIDKGDRMQAESGHSILLDTFFEAIASSSAPVLITTCGMDSEALEIASIFGSENVIVLRIHKDGHDFSQDSRSWVVNPSLNIKDVTNVHGQQREYKSHVAALARIFVDGRRSLADYAA